MNNKPKIIALCGRKECGKSTLGKICEEYGYKQISFAGPLKALICQLLNCDVKYINTHKTVINNYIFTEHQMHIINDETGIPFDYIYDKLHDIVLPTIRDILQFLGTDVIRSFDPNWHVNKIKEIIQKSPDNFYIDDVRFPNELEFVKSLNGFCWYIVRPTLSNISNHISEISLNWYDLDNIIINNQNKDSLMCYWRSVLNHYNDGLNDYPNNIITFKSQKDKEKYYLLPFTNIDKHIQVYNDLMYAVYDDYTVSITNPLIVETLKKYINEKR